MHKFIGIMLLISLCGLMGGSSVGVSAQTTATGGISGRVTEMDGVTPIAGALLRFRRHITDTEYHPITQFSTGEDGSYAVVGLPIGDYMITVGADNYAEESYNNQTSHYFPDLVTVTAGSTLSNLDFALEPPAIITGRVFEDDGVTPIAGVSISYRPSNGGMGGGTGEFPIPPTDANGRYRISIATDSYIISAHKDGYVYQSYPQPISVINGTTTADINFILDKGGGISGRVTAASGGAIDLYSSVYITRMDGNHTTSQRINTDGTYVISGLPAGVYTIYFVNKQYDIQYYNNKTTRSNGHTVIVADDTITPNINFIVNPSALIMGRVFEADGITPIREASILVESTDPLIPLLYRSTDSRADGHYSLPIISGVFRVRARAQGFLSEYYDNQMTMQSATPMTAVSNVTIPNINFSLERGDIGRISGQITEADGTTPISLAWTELFMLDGAFIEGWYTLPNGLYEYRNIPVGEYYLRVRSEGYVNQYFNAGGDALRVPITVSANTYTLNTNVALSSGLGDSLTVELNLLGMPPKPHPRWVMPLIVTLHSTSGASRLVDTVLMTDENGTLTIHNTFPESYMLHVEHFNHLPITVTDLTLAAGNNLIDLGTLRGGDANGDNIINVSDFSIFAANFNRSSDMIGFDTRADFNQDGIINIIDFSILATYFGQSG